MIEYALYSILTVGGFVVGWWVRKQRALAQVTSAEAKAQKILNETKAKQKEIVLEAQDKALIFIEEAKQEDARRRRDIKNLQDRLERRETAFSQKLLELQDKQQQLYDKVNKIERAKEKIKKIKEEQLEKLEKIAKMS